LDDEVATPADIDLAMRKGTNYPQGPLAWADSLGKATVRAELAALNERLGDRFAVANHWR
jgi:3-hydroxybutyryl-CoA dehydrogenase